MRKPKIKYSIILLKVIVAVVLIVNVPGQILAQTEDWAQKGPHPWYAGRYGHAMAYIGGGLALLYGGTSGGDLADTWVYNLSSDFWTQKGDYPSPPGYRTKHAMAYLGGDKVLLFGGYHNSSLTWDNEIWIYDLSDNSWTEAEPATRPSARFSHAMAYIGDGKVLLFGGHLGYGNVDGQTWIYDLSDNTWTQKTPVSSPLPRSSHALAYIGGDKVVLFGGCINWSGYGTFTDDTWIYDLSDNNWTQKTPSNQPPIRVGHDIAFLGGDRVVLFGGYGPFNGEYGSPLGDTWIYDLSDNTWSEDTGSPAPSARLDHTFCETSIDGSTPPFIFAGSHNFMRDDLSIELWTYGEGTPPPTTITVTSPNGGEIWEAGSSQVITWTSSGGVGNVMIEYSTNNGSTWMTIVASTANDGTHPWTVPNTPSTTCLVRVSETDGDPTDTSDGPFTIFAAPVIAVTSPNGGEIWEVGSSQVITWTSSAGVGNVMIEYSTDSGSTWTTIAASTANDGSEPWTVPNTPSTTCLVRVSETDGSPSDTSDAVFSIVPYVVPSITVIRPNGGERWLIGSTQDIIWSSTGIAGDVTIMLYFGPMSTTLGTALASSGLFSWIIDPIFFAGDNYRIRIWQAEVEDYSDDYFSLISAQEAGKDDFVGTWDGQGVYYRNSDTGAWVKLASPADMITTGDLDGDGIDDLIGLWPGQGGIWVKYSSDGTWVCLSSTARYIATGDMNGDGRADLLGTWDGQGVYYRNSVTGAWVKMASEATMITSGDIDGDGTDDLIGLWPAQGGIWVKYSSTGLWERLSSTAVHIAAGDMNGNGRDDLLGTWDGQGVYYRDSLTGAWVKMASPATLITAGDIDGDGTDDLIGIWPTQGGVWVKYSSDGTWERLSSTARDIAAGKMRPASQSSPMGAMGEEASAQSAFELPFPMGGNEEGPGTALDKRDLSMDGPGGWRFVYLEERNLEPGEDPEATLRRIPGPGEPDFLPREQENLFPLETSEQDKKASPGVKKRNIKR